MGPVQSCLTAALLFQPSSEQGQARQALHLPCIGVFLHHLLLDSECPWPMRTGLYKSSNTHEKVLWWVSPYQSRVHLSSINGNMLKDMIFDRKVDEPGLSRLSIVEMGPQLHHYSVVQVHQLLKALGNTLLQPEASKIHQGKPRLKILKSMYLHIPGCLGKWF